MKKHIVAVVFKHRYDKDEWGSREYHYNTFISGLKEGDLVVVETQHGFAVAQVVRYIRNSDNAFRYIVQKVELEQYEAQKQKEMQLSFLQAEIEERVNALRQQIELESLAKQDKTLSELLEKFNSLSK